MKKILLIILIATVVAAGCQKAEELKYSGKDNIMLDFQGSSRDSIIHTFAYTPGKGIDTVYIPVRISGSRTDSSGADRKFILRAEKDSSTAKEDLHFKPLEPYYTIKKGTGFTQVPIIIYSKDPELTNKSVTLHFRLYGNEDFDVKLTKLVYGKLVLSNKLERPNWWGMWFGAYYSRIKHEFFLIVTGLTELSTDGLDAPKNLYFESLVRDFMADPFKWVNKNPSKGYVIEKDGATENYVFYSSANPEKKIPYRKNLQTGLYYFIDEEGNEVK